MEFSLDRATELKEWKQDSLRMQRFRKKDILKGENNAPE